MSQTPDKNALPPPLPQDIRSYRNGIMLWILSSASGEKLK